MKLKVEFQNEMAKLTMTPEDEWEQKMLGAVSKGNPSLNVKIEYDSEGHYTYGKCKAVRVLLFSGEQP